MNYILTLQVIIICKQKERGKGQNLTVVVPGLKKSKNVVNIKEIRVIEHVESAQLNIIRVIFLKISLTLHR